MKKIFALAVVSLFFVSCATYSRLDLNQLTTGMTKKQVIATVGKPQRILAVSDTNDGYQEVLEYRTSRDEIYALEFWNDRLTGYEYLYDDVNYVPPVYPVGWYPEFGRPLVVYPSRPPVIINRPGPGQPSRPSQPSRPNRPNRPETSRPNPSNPSNPSNRPNTSTRPTTRPSPITRPGTGSSSRPSGSNTNSRPSTPDRSGLER